MNTRPITLHVRRRTLDESVYRGYTALESDYTRLITEPALVFDDDVGQITLAYLHVAEDCDDLVAALHAIEISRDTRTGGLPTLSRTFGYQPRNARRNNWCTPAGLAQENAQAHATLVAAASIVSRAYRQYNPALWERHRQLAEAVRSDWQLEDGPFTSGIFNRDSQLPYHLDRGTFERVWSAMLSFKHDVRGGYLSIPAYDLAVEVADHSLTMFDGQGLMHGVTPFQHLSVKGYRYTVVYYSLQQMWQCLPPGEEVKRQRRMR